jgi:protein ImuA
MTGAPRLQTLRRQIAAQQQAGRKDHGVAAFGDPVIDGCLPGGGLPRGAWHAVTADGLEAETGAAPGAFAALLVRSLAADGTAVWVLRRDDLYAPGLSALGLPAQQLIFVRTDDDAQVLAALEDAARTPGVRVVVGEADAVSLIAGRRLQLACEINGATVILVERRPYGGPAGRRDEASPSTRWRVAPAPSGDHGFGLGAPRWRLALERCRGGRPGAWTVEMKEEDHGPYPLRVVAELAGHRIPAPDRFAAAG